MSDVESHYKSHQVDCQQEIHKFKIKRIYANIGFGVIALLIGIVYTTKSGLYWLDIVDYFMNNYGLLVVGILQCFAIGYFYSRKDVRDYTGAHTDDRSIFSIPTKIVALREYANSKSDFTIGPWWDFCVKYLTPIVVGILFLTNIVDRVRTSYGGYSRLAEFLGGWLILIIFIVVAVILYKKKGRE